MSAPTGPMQLGQLDLHLINEGRHEQLWDVLGAHVTPEGTHFAVWAPGAREVQVAGDFNDWTGAAAPMTPLASSGVWETFVPGVGPGARYAFMVHGRDGEWRSKADPMARYAEVPPEHASIVYGSSYTWDDEAWMTARAEQQPIHRPMSVYEVHLGSWRRGKSYRDLAEELVGHVAWMGFTHVELMPVMQHPYGGSWGYHVTGYYAPDSRLGTPDDFRYLVDRLHRAGIGVILDWVPGHFATDPWALARFDGGPTYEHPDPQRGWHPEWGSFIFDYGRPEVRNFLVANALYWLEEFHADGLRVDGVASMLYLDYARQPGEWSPNLHGGRENLEAVGLLQEINATAYKRTPGIMTIAEESTSWPGVTRPTSHGGLGFGFKWDMGWMHDTLDYLARDPIHRRYHHHELTFASSYARSENFVLPLSHDEVVHGKGSLIRKMPGDRWQQLATLRAYFAFQWAHIGKQLLFMGAELGQESEWAESRELDWWLLDKPEHQGLERLVRELNLTYAATPALWAADDSTDSFGWLDADDADRNTYAFLRRSPGAPDLVCVTNFAGMPHADYRLRLPADGVWEEALNTDAATFGGSGVGNHGSVLAVDGVATMVVPPLATIWLRPAAVAGPAGLPATER